jgi:hypothetical protein
MIDPVGVAGTACCSKRIKLDTLDRAWGCHRDRCSRTQRPLASELVNKQSVVHGGWLRLANFVVFVMCLTSSSRVQPNSSERSTHAFPRWCSGVELKARLMKGVPKLTLTMKIGNRAADRSQSPVKGVDAISKPLGPARFRVEEVRCP